MLIFKNQSTYCCFLSFGSILHTDFDSQKTLDLVGEKCLNELLCNRSVSVVKIWTVKIYVKHTFLKTIFNKALNYTKAEWKWGITSTQSSHHKSCKCYLTSLGTVYFFKEELIETISHKQYYSSLIGFQKSLTPRWGDEVSSMLRNGNWVLQCLL